MPGLTVLAGRNGARPSTASMLPRLRALEHFDDYATSVLVDSPHLLVACTRYAAYPLAIVERGRHLVVLEGRIYAPSDGAFRLLGLAPDLLGPAADTAPLERWLRAVDGDFVAVIVDTACDRAVVVGDRYGRLPLYTATDGDAVLVSRELPLLARGRCPDRTAMAQFLTFGHPLGQSTLLAGVERLGPATLLALPGGARRVLVPENFEARTPPAMPMDAVEQRLGDALVEACRVRTERDRGAIVSLSGGIDSRLVAGSLARCGVRASGATHVDDRGSEQADADVARQVAERLGMPWRLVRIPAPTGSEVAALLRMKFGANYLGMSRVLPFLDAVVAEHGRDVVFFTGDQGDRVMGPVTPLAPLTDDAAVARYILRRETILPSEIAAAATGLSHADLLETLLARVRSYPERQPVLKYLHFLFQERALRWAFEGEDRNRCYFWSVSPFFAPDVFELAMAVPPAAKAFHRLRIGVMSAVAPELVRIVDVTTRGRLASRSFRIRQGLRTMARRTAFRALGRDTERWLARLVHPVDGYGARSAVLQLVRDQLDHGPAGSYFARPVIERILSDAGSIAREQFSVLFTVTCLIDALEGGGAGLAQYGATRFV